MPLQRAHGCPGRIPPKRLRRRLRRSLPYAARSPPGRFVRRGQPDCERHRSRMHREPHGEPGDGAACPAVPRFSSASPEGRSRSEETRHLRPVAVQAVVIRVIYDSEMAVAPAEHVLLLRDAALHVGTAWYICVGHVEDRETHAVRSGQYAGDLTPVAGKHLDLEPRLRAAPLCSPLVEILHREAVIEIGWIGLLECSDRLLQDLPPARAVRATEPAAHGLLIRAQVPSRHHCARLMGSSMICRRIRQKSQTWRNQARRRQPPGRQAQMPRARATDSRDTARRRERRQDRRCSRDKQLMSP